MICVCFLVVSVPVGYQKVEDGEEEGEGEGGGEKGQELCVMNGTAGGVKDNGTISKRNAKHSQPHTATKVAIMHTNFKILFSHFPLVLPLFIPIFSFHFPCRGCWMPLLFRRFSSVWPLVSL